MLIQGAFSLGGSSGGGGMPDSLTLVEKSSLPGLDLKRLIKKAQVYMLHVDRQISVNVFVTCVDTLQHCLSVLQYY